MRFPTSNKLSPRQKLLLSYLGSDYCKNRIDGENVIYRDLGDYDIEISGGSYRRPFYIFVWQKCPHLEIVERYKNISNNFDEMEALLNEITLRFKCRETGNNYNTTNNE